METSNSITPSQTPFMDTNEVDALLCCLQNFTQPAKALEWGSGRSTIYFSRYLPAGGTWISIEHQASWHATVSGMLEQQRVTNVSLHLIPPNTEYIEGGDDGNFTSFRDYIIYPAKLSKQYDFILVDGRARVECMAVGWNLLAENGIMVLHDAQRVEYQHGIPQSCSYLKIINPNEFMEGPLTLLFMAKSPHRIKELQHQLAMSLPSEIVIETNCADIKLESAHTALFINTYYGAFLNDHYNTNQGLSQATYATQKHSLQKTCFGDSDFYSSGLAKSGWRTEDLIVNCQPLQSAWARESGIVETDLPAIAREQIRRHSPAVIYLQDLSLATAEFMAAIRPHTKLIVGQIASPVPQHADLKAFDIIFSSFPHFVELFRSMGITAYYQPLAFEPRILQQLPNTGRPYPVTFVGGISAHHGKGLDTLQKIAELVPLDCWGYGASTLPTDSPLRIRHHGEVWGVEMFGILRHSAITINRHIDVAENYANNMRLFEATGCGALLITDYKDNLNDLFEIGKEVVAYRSPEEAAALIKYYQANPDEAAKIARAGQERTLRDHTYAQRMELTAEILERHLRYFKEKSCYQRPDKISTEYHPIHVENVREGMTSGWKSAEIPAKQRWLVQQELAAMYAGNIPKQFAVLAELLRAHISASTTVLEIGCSSGYYYEILEYLLNKQIHYTGVDYSDAMINMARNYYSLPEFVMADGKCLPFNNQHFDIVISSCVLLHVPNYREHIVETARVAKRFILAHRTPVCRSHATACYRKQAYGVETVELQFNESEFISLFNEQNFSLISYCEINAHENDNFCINYLFERKLID